MPPSKIRSLSGELNTLAQQGAGRDGQWLQQRLDEFHKTAEIKYTTVCNQNDDLKKEVELLKAENKQLYQRHIDLIIQQNQPIDADASQLQGTHSIQQRIDHVLQEKDAEATVAKTGGAVSQLAALHAPSQWSGQQTFRAPDLYHGQQGLTTASTPPPKTSHDYLLNRADQHRLHTHFYGPYCSPYSAPFAESRLYEMNAARNNRLRYTESIAPMGSPRLIHEYVRREEVGQRDGSVKHPSRLPHFPPPSSQYDLPTWKTATYSDHLPMRRSRSPQPREPIDRQRDSFSRGDIPQKRRRISTTFVRPAPACRLCWTLQSACDGKTSCTMCFRRGAECSFEDCKEGDDCNEPECQRLHPEQRAAWSQVVEV